MTIVEKIRHLLHRYRYRDAVTGHYVTKAYAKAHPTTTVRERRW